MCKERTVSGYNPESSVCMRCAKKTEMTVPDWRREFQVEKRRLDSAADASLQSLDRALRLCDKETGEVLQGLKEDMLKRRGHNEPTDHRVQQCRDVLQHMRKDPQSGRVPELTSWVEAELIDIKANLLEQSAEFDGFRAKLDVDLQSISDKIQNLTGCAPLAGSRQTSGGVYDLSATDLVGATDTSLDKDAEEARKAAVVEWRARKEVERRLELAEAVAVRDAAKRAERDRLAACKEQRKLLLQYKAEREEELHAQAAMEHARDMKERRDRVKAFRASGVAERLQASTVRLLEKRRPARQKSAPPRPVAVRPVSAKLHQTTTSLLLRIKAIEEDAERRNRQAGTREALRGASFGGEVLRSGGRATPNWLKL